MKTDMKFPCLVSCNAVQCIALNENHVIHLEGHLRGQVSHCAVDYSAPDGDLVMVTDGHLEFISDAIKNSSQFFSFGATPHTRTIDISDIDFSPWKGGTKLFFDDVDTLKRKQQFWKPTVGEQVTMTFNGDVHRTGELLFVSDQYAIVRIGEKQEQHYHLGAWKINKPVSNEDKLKKLWFELGQDIDLFITQVSEQYKEQ